LELSQAKLQPEVAAADPGRFQHRDPAALLRQAEGNRGAKHAGPDDDHVTHASHPLSLQRVHAGFQLVHDGGLLSAGQAGLCCQA